MHILVLWYGQTIMDSVLININPLKNINLYIKLEKIDWLLII